MLMILPRLESALDIGTLPARCLYPSTWGSTSADPAVVWHRHDAYAREEHFQVEHVSQGGLDMCHRQLALFYPTVLPAAVWWVSRGSRQKGFTKR
jgi:hypothetical protein